MEQTLAVQTNGKLKPITKVVLPTITELRDNDSLSQVGKQNDLNVLLNEEPKPEWVKEHPFVKGHKYIPANRLEWLMTYIFVQWHIEILNTTLYANSIAVTIRVHYLNPVTGQMQWTDGVGASALQVDKGANPTDISKLKASAVEMSLPKAKTEAFKDAVGDLGRLFGRDLNRKDVLDYRSMAGRIDGAIEPGEIAQIEAMLKQCGDEYRAQLFDFFKVSSTEEISKGIFKQVIARLTDRLNNKNGK